MAPSAIPRVLRGYDTAMVDARFEELESELERLRAELAEVQEANTTLRLSVIKQVEEASAEAAVVLGHARSEATRIRESAVAESDALIDRARRTSEDLVREATEVREDALAERDAQKLSAADILDRAHKEADTILAGAREQAESLAADAAAAKEESDRRIKAMEDNLRMQKLELDRIEADVRDQADAYAMRVYREADDYHRSMERRALELEKQAEEILHVARVNAHDHSAKSLAEARRYLEDALGLVNSIFSDVNGSMIEVQRIRAVLGESVDRISRQESSQAVLAGRIESPATESEPADSPPS